jgi:hypothetical protein
MIYLLGPHLSFTFSTQAYNVSGSVYRCNYDSSLLASFYLFIKLQTTYLMHHWTTHAIWNGHITQTHVSVLRGKLRRPRRGAGFGGEECVDQYLRSPTHIIGLIIMHEDTFTFQFYYGL